MENKNDIDVDLIMILYGVDDDNVDYRNDIRNCLLEFAKLHVEAALKEASKSAKTKTEYWVNLGGDHEEVIVDKSTILNAYPLTNIK